MSDKQKIDLKLLNSNFSVVADDEKYVRKIADFVNENLDAILARNPYANHLQVALLASMNIAEMVFDEKNKVLEKEAEGEDNILKIAALNEDMKILEEKIEEQQKNIDDKKEVIELLNIRINEKENLLNEYRDKLKQAKLDSESDRKAILNLQSQLFESQIELNKSREEAETADEVEEEQQSIFMREIW